VAIKIHPTCNTQAILSLHVVGGSGIARRMLDRLSVPSKKFFVPSLTRPELSSHLPVNSLEPRIPF